MRRTIAIGDIHGCASELNTLLSLINPSPSDQLVFLGDYIDRGPDSHGVIERLLELHQTQDAVFLLGNHDVWMIRARRDREWFASWLSKSVGGVNTLQSYGQFKDVPPSHWDFLTNICRNYYEATDHIFVHGAVDPDLPMAEQSEHTLLWERVYNQRPHVSGKRIICGHTSQKNGHPYNVGHAVCIDTFCHGGGYLTALCAETNQLWQVRRDGTTHTGFLHQL